MRPQSLVNGVATTQVALADRGLAYGDGVFETILVHEGHPVWWDAHMARLRRGCEALAIVCPEVDGLRREANSLIADASHAVLKLIVTRGESGRGYAFDSEATPTRALSLHPVPKLASRDYAEGVVVRWCQTQLAIQPRLAGLKHLNRLEQVLARNEWRDQSMAEGLMCDSEGRVVCATAANLFIVRGNQLATPALQRCGIAGMAREWILQQQVVDVVDLSLADIENADELFLCSSLRGILPIARLDGRRWTVGAMTRGLQEALWREVPALRPAGATLA